MRIIKLLEIWTQKWIFICVGIKALLLILYMIVIEIICRLECLGFSSKNKEGGP